MFYPLWCCRAIWKRLLKREETDNNNIPARSIGPGREKETSFPYVTNKISMSWWENVLHELPLFILVGKDITMRCSEFRQPENKKKLTFHTRLKKSRNIFDGDDATSYVFFSFFPPFSHSVISLSFSLPVLIMDFFFLHRERGYTPYTHTHTSSLSPSPNLSFPSPLHFLFLSFLYSIFFPFTISHNVLHIYNGAKNCHTTIYLILRSNPYFDEK